MICRANGIGRPWPLVSYRRFFRAVGIVARYQLRADQGGSISPHGSHSRYNIGCRCDACRAGQVAYMASLRGKDPPQHGTQSGYVNYGCRCDECKKAGSVRNRINRERRAQREATSPHKGTEA